MNAWLSEAEHQVRARAAGHELRAAIGGDTIGRDALERHQPLAPAAPPLAVGAVADFEVDRGARTGDDRPRERLYPKIMRGGRRGHGDGASQQGGEDMAQNGHSIGDQAGLLRRYTRIVAGVVAFCFTAAPAWAHSGASTTGGFAEGLMHPIAGPDHLLAMVAVGIWGAFLGRPLVYVLPTLFPIVMALGGVAGLAGLAFPPIELGIAVSVVVLGLAIAARWRAPALVAAPLVAAFALFHGYAHGAELPAAADPALYSAGFVIATGLLHLAGIALGLLAVRPAGALALRVAGGAIAGAGLWFAAAALA